MKRTFHYLVIILILLGSVSCQSKKDKIFTSLSHKRTGIDFKNWVKESETFNVIDYSYLYNGAGVAIGDINNDGLEDIYFASNLTKNRLYLNKGNFRFKDITDKAGVGGPGTWSNGVTMADINGDGFLDIYVCTSTDGRPQYRKNLLYINNGDLTFTECAAKYGIDGSSYSTHSVFFDYDKDGDLDLFVINHGLNETAVPNARLKKVQNPKSAHILYMNTGEKFLDVSKESGIIQNVLNFGLGVAVTDFNNDSWPDIYVCNDYFEQDYLFINQKNGTFSEELKKYFDHISISSMGCDAADFNNDGYTDLFTLDMLPEDNYNQKLVAGPDRYSKVSMLKDSGFYHQTTRNMLQMNNHGSYFTEIGQYAAVFSTNWSWSPLLCDFDNDGYKDLYISNGYGKNNTHMDFIKLTVEQVVKQKFGQEPMGRKELLQKIPATVIKNYIFRNNRDLTFTNVTETWGDEVPNLSNGAAYSDLDNDGDMDLVVSNINEYPFVYRNNSSEQNLNHYLKISLEGSGMNKKGIGARVQAFCGNQVYTQELMPSRGYMSSGSQNLIFGLGKADIIDSLKIIWPDLNEQVITSVRAGQTITLQNSKAYRPRPEVITKINPLFVQSKDNILKFMQTEDKYVDFEKQLLIPHFLSTQGPHITKGDVNNDGLEDIFIGGSAGFSGKLFIQARDGSFALRQEKCFEEDRACEDIGVLLFDSDGDKDLDLYVVSGGNNFPKESPLLQDRLYLNDGHGNYVKTADRLPVMLTSGSCVKAADIDNDGDPDLFVGGRLIPAAYPLAPRSYILENNGKGYFRDVTEKYNKLLLNPGMVTDALWTDFNSDGKTDLLLAGEWMKVRLFRNDGGILTEITDQCGLKESEGWWNTLSAVDFDNDGDIDYVAGNLGLNSMIKASDKEPATIYAKDFDNNGTLDPIFCYFINGVSYPECSLDDLQDQMPFMQKRFPTYESYANATVSSMFSPEELKGVTVLYAKKFASCILENKGNNQFILKDLPMEAQLAPIYAITSGDFNNDGYTDLLLAGNFYGNRVKFGEDDGCKGLLLTGNETHNFVPQPYIKSGLFIRGEVRVISQVVNQYGKLHLLFILNNDSARIYELNTIVSGQTIKK